MELDDELEHFEKHGAPPLPDTDIRGYVENDGAKIWYSVYGNGTPVVMLHSGLGHSRNWGYQLQDLLNSNYRVILVDSRGHGRSTRNEKPYSYELMASDVVAVLDRLNVAKSMFVGWSDGAIISLVVAMNSPERVNGVFFFGCNMDLSGTKEMKPSITLDRCLSRHARDYAELSSTPDKFKDFTNAVVKMMETQPNYSANELSQIKVPVTIVHSEHDEFIKQEHAEYLANTIPNAQLQILNEVSHFAPLQRPQYFNNILLKFLEKFN